LELGFSKKGGAETLIGTSKFSNFLLLLLIMQGGFWKALIQLPILRILIVHLLCLIFKAWLGDGNFPSKHSCLLFTNFLFT
jgi:hypothetical protein